MATRKPSTTPIWETTSRRPLSRGRVPGTDRSLWAYRTVPLGPVSDVRRPSDALIPGEPLQAAYYELAQLTRLGVARNRMMARSSYRHFRLELINVPVPFAAAEGSAATYLNQRLGNQRVYHRLAVFGVKLTPTLLRRTGSWKTTLRSAADSFAESQAPISDFDADFELVDAALNRVGLPPMTVEEYRWMNAWWNRGKSAAVPSIPHTEHLHTFRTMAALRQTTGGDYEDCTSWGDHPDRSDFTFAAVEDLDIGYTSIASDKGRWCKQLLDAGAQMVSITGLIEPAAITRQELASQRRSVLHNMEEAVNLGKLPKAEHEERLGHLQEVDDAYGVARKDAPPTLVDTTITVAFEGAVDDVSTLGAGVTLNPMLDRQPAAWVSTMIASSANANPHMHDLPCMTLSHSGLPDISRAGDSTGKLALVGLTEHDRQPVYVSSTAAADENTFPMFAVSAATGSGKTQLLAWMAYQWALLGVPQFVIDPKEGSDLSPLFRSLGVRYREYSMDDLVGADGGLDPIRLSPNRETGVALATSLLHSVNPWGSRARRDDFITHVANGVAYGVERGANGTAEALRVAERDGVVRPEATASIWEFLNTYVAVRTLFGERPGEANSMTAFDGLTYIKVGQSSLQLPQDSKNFDIERAEPGMRISAAIVRMMVRGSLMALAGRDGVIHADEAWMVEKSAPEELEAVGRLARQKRVLFGMYNQTPSGPANSGLGNYVSRFFNGMITDESEAVAGADFAGITNPEVVSRITARKGEAGALDPQFLDLPGGKREVTRGSVFYCTDLANRFAPVEVLLPPDFLAAAGSGRQEQLARETAAGLAAPASVVAPAW